MLKDSDLKNSRTDGRVSSTISRDQGKPRSGNDRSTARGTEVKSSFSKVSNSK